MDRIKRIKKMTEKKVSEFKGRIAETAKSKANGI